ncbi:hypothetical protein B5F88_14485 [Flavonifractor sp. An306]|nr:hypothetical protein B5F88_14485 [Flavonifractor sp. An306]
MRRRTLYTAVGHFKKVVTRDGAYPVVLVNRQEYRMDPQEMAVWSILNWRLLDAQGLEEYYEPMFQTLRLEERRTLENCLGRLVTRGLVAAGHGETDFEALYDLLSNLYVVPISESLPLRTVTFLKMILLDGVSFSRAKQIFQKSRLSEGEARVMALARQALLSTAELIRCVELGITDVSSDEKVMDALYGDADATSDNMGDLMRSSQSRGPVTLSVANLCLHKQIIFERV